MKLLIKHRLTLLGLVIGALGGFAYYYFVGCTSGTCPITSQPLNSTAYGALLGVLLFGTLKKDQTNDKKIINKEHEDNDH